MFQQIRSALPVVFSLCLSACGGSGCSANNSGSAAMSIVLPPAVTVASSDPLTFSGSVASTAGAITGMAWRLEALTLGSYWVTALGNADCKTMQKNAAGTEASCVLQLTPPTVLTADYTYKLTLSATDAKGNSIRGATTLLVRKEASSTTNPVATVNPDMTAVSGDKVSLACAGSGGTPAAGSNPYAYQWIISDAAGLNLTLAAPNTAGASFSAPVVTTSTTVKLQCRVTDDKQKTGSAIQTVLINPLIKPTVIPISVSGGVVPAGSGATLDGSKSIRMDANGKEVEGTIYYFWKQKSGPTLDISTPFNSVVGIAFPAFVSSRTSFVFTLNASNAPINASRVSSEPVQQVDVTYYVDPLPAISLVTYTPTQIVQSSSNVVLKVEAPSNSGSNIVYYSWSQISGPPVMLAGAASGNAGFIAPVVTADTTLVFRVSAGYQPVTVATPGTASIDVIVMVTPIPVAP